MPDLLLEFFSEEIPARMQRKAAEDLRKLVTDALVERGFVYEGAKAFSTPRRLALTIAGLPAKGQDIREEKKGPRVGSPDVAVQGFLKSAGLTSLDQAKIESDPKKGEFYVAHLERPGLPTVDVLKEIIPTIIRSFPWPKSMRWGASSTSSSSLRWVRPLQSILCTFGPETEEPVVVDFTVDGIVAGDVTRGHRFHAPDLIKVRRFDDYVAKLEAAKVILDADRRKDIILHDARNLAFAHGLELVEDEALLEEVSGLVEWPVVLMGSFDPAFLNIPPEVVRATIRANQKCFVVRGQSAIGNGQSTADIPLPTAPLVNRFIITSNLMASDGGKAIIAGNERVVKARLSDAKYFWDTDRKPLPDFADQGTLLERRLAKLRALNIVFHEKLGTQGERIDRIVALARELAPMVGADPDLAARAALLCKADLVTEMVGEFPEVQGLMGRRYAELQGEHPSVCAAIEDHYKPQGPSDRVPTDKVAITVALADKLDTLVGFWAIDEKPTGSKDPFALRRAALGVIRLVVENGVRLRLHFLFSELVQLAEKHIDTLEVRRVKNLQRLAIEATNTAPYEAEHLLEESEEQRNKRRGPMSFLSDDVSRTRVIYDEPPQAVDLLAFFHDRLKTSLRDSGARHDLVDAVLAGGASSPSPHASGGEGSRVGGGAASPQPDMQAQTPPTLTLPTASGGSGNPGSGAPANDDLLMIVRRVEALTAFLATEDGANLVAGTKRAANILRAEEKKDGKVFDGTVDAALLALPQEQALHTALTTAVPQASAAVAAENFAGAMTALAALRPAVDAFFEHVQVNADDPALRLNRLNLLGQLRAATASVADFSKISG